MSLFLETWVGSERFAQNMFIFTSGHSSDCPWPLAVERDAVIVAAADAGDVALKPGSQAVTPQNEEGAREADRQLRGHQARRLIEPSARFWVQFPAAATTSLGQRKERRITQFILIAREENRTGIRREVLLQVCQVCFWDKSSIFYYKFLRVMQRRKPINQTNLEMKSHFCAANAVRRKMSVCLKTSSSKKVALFKFWVSRSKANKP